MDAPRAKQDLLVQPSRARIFDFLVERRGEAGTDEIARRLGLHPNGVRRHLERLQAAGMVERRRLKQPRGRPTDRWAVAPTAEPGGEPPRDYGHLAAWLARAARTASSLDDIERTGREIGRELAPGDPAADPTDAFRQAFSALGFEPRLDVRSEGGFHCELENCPYSDSVRAGGDVVCTLHRGITEGLLEELDPEVDLTEFSPRDPEQAGCVVEVSR
jgi:predicted ArsR family transcriptional regulator